VGVAAGLKFVGCGRRDRSPSDDTPVLERFLSWVGAPPAPHPRGDFAMPSDDKPVPRILQQQPVRESDPQQQRGGQAAGAQVEGEGSYSASRDYQKNIKEYLDQADVQADAEAARPRSESEARELEQAEREGRSHSKGEH